MTIIMSALTPGGIVMAGEGRCIRDKSEGPINRDDTNTITNFEIVTDNAEKVHLIADRFGLAYSGLDFNDITGWCLQNEINEFDRIVRLNLRSNLSFNVRDAAGIFNGLLQKSKSIPPGEGCDFYWAGYDPRTGKPFQVCYRKGQDVTDTEKVPCGWRTDDPDWPEGCYENGMSMQGGKVEVIQEFIKGKIIRWDRMHLRDAIECVEWLLVSGTKALKFFAGHQQVSGGDIDILVITPTGAGFVKHKTLSLFRESDSNVGA